MPLPSRLCPICDPHVRSSTPGAERSSAAILSGSARHFRVCRNAASFSLASRLGFSFAPASPGHRAVMKHLHSGCGSLCTAAAQQTWWCPEQGPDCLVSSQGALTFPPPRHSSDLADAKQKYIIKSKRCWVCLSLPCFPCSLLHRPSIRDNSQDVAPRKHLAHLPLTRYKPLGQTVADDQDILVMQPLRKCPCTRGFVHLAPAAG